MSDQEEDYTAENGKDRELLNTVDETEDEVQPQEGADALQGPIEEATEEAPRAAEAPAPEKQGGHGFDRPFRRAVALVLAGLLVGGGSLGFGIGAGLKYFESSKFNNTYYMEKGTTAEATPISTVAAGQPIVKIAEQVGPAVIPITSSITVRDAFMNQSKSEGTGSGVIFNISQDAIYILTNNHVVADATEVTVGITDTLTLKAQLVGVDSDTDLAVVKVMKSQVPADELTKVKPAVLGNSDAVKVGETAIAIGNPLGYSRTVTAGIISALDRRVDESLNRLSLIQTDAAINPGNSGGALVNAAGEVIGINTIKIADTKVEGIGFAIPINSAKPVIDQLLTKGYVSRPYLGIAGRNIDEDMSKLYELPIGVIVMDVVKGSAAEGAGIQKGDVLISFESQQITSMEQLIGLIGNHKVGDRVTVKLVRDGNKKIEATVTLKEKNAQ